MASSTVEQYLKTIYLIAQRTRVACVPMKVLADSMGVTPGTATSMAKHLHNAGHVVYVPRKGTTLTDEGRLVALRVIRRHRLIETFLERVLGYDWSEVHADAEELEHAVSDRFVEKIDAILGHPETDPHGDSIPNADGELVPRQLIPIGNIVVGETHTVARLTHDSQEFLHLMNEHNIRPGRRIRVRERDQVAETVTLETDQSDTLTVSGQIAQRIMVEKAPTTPLS